MKKGEKMLKIAICDDDEYFLKKERTLIKKYLEKNEYDYEIFTYTSGKELLEEKEKITEYQIIFLDINMEEIDGMKTAEVIRKYSIDTYLVFVTAFITYAIEGYKVEAVRYLLKDDKCFNEAIIECFETILNKMNYREKKQLFEFQEGEKEISLKDIIYIESDLHKLIFHLTKGKIRKYTMYAKLNSINESLKECGFCRIHQSFLVNLKYVEKVERYKVELWNKKTLNIAKKRYSEVKSEFIYYRGSM